MPILLLLLLPQILPHLSMDPGGSFRVTGWDPAGHAATEWTQLFGVYVEPRTESSPPISGRYVVEKGELIFSPRYPLVPGVKYRAVFRPPGEAEVSAVFEVPKAAGPPVTIEEIYPTSSAWPENILKLYIHFSAPMSRGEMVDRIRLLDAQGKPVELPFLELAEELWDPEGKRLTVLFDPGRIKRGLVPNRDVGPPIMEGGNYTLVIDQGWPDAHGNPLRETYRRQFHVGPAVRTAVDLKTWRITAPLAGSSGPLEIRFPRPMDRALALRLISVADVPGTAEVDSEETRWRFTPERPWKAGAYQLRVGTALEDISGNKVDRPFDVDVFDHVEKTISTTTKTLRFTVK